MCTSTKNKRANSRLSIFIALCVSIAGIARNSHAQTFSNFYSDAALIKAQSVFSNDIQSLFKVIRRHLSPEENRRLGNVRLIFPLRTCDTQPISNPLNFYSNYKERIVCLPVQSKVFFSDLLLAYVWLVDNGYQPQTVLDYAGMVGYYSRKSISARPPEQYFGDHFPLPLPVLQIPGNAAKNPTLADNRDQKVTDAMTFAFCHELGHVFYQHPSYDTLSGEQARANETQADAFAVDILRRISRAPFGTVFYFLTLAHFMGSQGEQLFETRTHPLSSDRLQSLALVMEKEATDFAKNESNSEKWSRDLKTLAGQLNAAAAGLDSALFLHDLQVTNLNAQNMKERLAPRRTLTYMPTASVVERISTGKFSGAYDCDILLVKGLPPMQVRLILSRTGATVNGEYTYLASGITGHLAGDIDGESLNFTWSEPPNLGFPERGGKGLFRYSNDGATITGDWGRNPEKEGLGKWNLKRVRR
jgi:hypothetical protein